MPRNHNVYIITQAKRKKQTHSTHSHSVYILKYLLVTAQLNLHNILTKKYRDLTINSAMMHSITLFSKTNESLLLSYDRLSSF